MKVLLQALFLVALGVVGGCDYLPEQIVLAQSCPQGQTWNAQTGACQDDAAPTETEKTPGTCWDAWKVFKTTVLPKTRPSTVDFPGLRIQWQYKSQPAEVTLVQLTGMNVTNKSSPPLKVGTHSGVWVELQDAQGNALHTQLQWQLVPEAQEAVGTGGEFSMGAVCPTSGSIMLYGNPQSSGRELGGVLPGASGWQDGRGHHRVRSLRAPLK